MKLGRKQRKFHTPVIPFLFLFFPPFLFCPRLLHSFEIEILTGTALNSPSPFIVETKTKRESMLATWETRPFSDGAPWYSLGLWFGKFGLRIIHNKMYLRSDHMKFDISHGFNMLTGLLRFSVSQKWKVYGISGGGIILSHPDGEVFGREFSNEEGGPFGNGYYYFSGFTAGFGLGRDFDVFSISSLNVKFSFQSALFLSYAVMPIADGDAKIPIIAHLLINLGPIFVF